VIHALGAHFKILDFFNTTNLSPDAGIHRAFPFAAPYRPMRARRRVRGITGTVIISAGGKRGLSKWMSKKLSPLG
jgi:hypothetical protein